MTSRTLSAGTMTRIFLPFAAGYFLSYLYRVVNAVISPDLVADLGLNPSDLGLLTAAYFITFAAAQLPLGVALDRFGPRKTESLLLVFAAAGALLFGLSESKWMLVFGRGLIGFGVSACLMAAFTAFVAFFPSHRLPLVNGIQMAAGGLGALCATAPTEAALPIVGWRGLFIALSVMTLVVSIAVLTVVPESRRPGEKSSMSDQISGVARVFTSPLFWRIAPVTVMSQATFLSIQGLWAGPWLRDVGGLSRVDAAEVLLLVAASMIAGFLILGTISSRVSSSGATGPFFCPVLGMGMFMCVQALLLLRPPIPAQLLWPLFGFFGTSGILSYAALSQQFDRELAGRVNTGLNVLVFIAAFAGQWGIGIIVNHWRPLAGGAYRPQAYIAGFALMLALQVISLFWFWAGGWMTRNAGHH